MQVFISFYPLQNIKDAKIPTKIMSGSTFNSKVMAQSSPASPAPKRAKMSPKGTIAAKQQSCK